MQLLYIKEEVLKPKVSSGVLWSLSFAIERKLPVGDNKKEKDHGPPKAIFINITRHSETSPQAGRGNPFPLCSFSFSFRRVLFSCRDRASGGPLFPAVVSCLPLAANKVYTFLTCHCEGAKHPWQSVPHGRASGFFNRPRSGSVSRSPPTPCFGGI